MKNRFQQVCKTHRFVKSVSLSEREYQKQVLLYNLAFLRYDLSKGDITTRTFFRSSAKTTAVFVCKQNGILAGMQEMKFLIASIQKKFLSSSVILKSFREDGDSIKKGDIIASLQGRIIDILKIERMVLNLLQRMSGIATLTRSFVDKIPSSVLLTSTRKTPWCLLDKRAVLAGGGGIHRLHLADAVLIKDTHLLLFHKNWQLLFEKLSHSLNRTRFVEIEVESIQDAYAIIDVYQQFFLQQKVFFPLYLMFDNMKPAVLKKVIQNVKKTQIYNHVYFEASGGIHLQNVQSYGKTGIDIISIGYLTHSAKALDISLRIPVTVKKHS